MKFEWDPDKAAHNLRKHGVSFHEAAGVFADPLAITYDDPDHSTTEHRFIIIGTARNGMLLFVAHTERGDDIRLISARKTTPQERRQYEEAN